MLARRIPLFLATFALIALFPAAASANTKKLKLPQPAEGKTALIQFEVKAKNGKEIGPVKAAVKAPRGLGDELGVVIEAYRRDKGITVIAYVINPKDASGRPAGQFEDMHITLTSGRKISVKDVRRIMDVVAELTEEQVDFICRKKLKGRKLIKQLLGTFVDGKRAPAKLVKAIRAHVCGELSPEQEAFLEGLGLTVSEDPEEEECEPGSAACPLGSFSCAAFLGNLFEGICNFHFPSQAAAAFTGTSFNALRIEASGGNTFEQCFHETAPCQVQNPEGGNSAIVWTFGESRSSSGELNLRSSNQEYANWSELTIYGSTDGGTTFERLNSFDPE